MADEQVEDTPRTEQDFAADFGELAMDFLQGKTSADTAEAPAETDTGEAAREPLEDATGRLHGEDGKFVPKDEDTEDPQEGLETTPEEGSVEDTPEDMEGAFVIEVDDEETAERVSSVLEKYDGDPAKALVALAEAQSLIGRKGNEAAQANAELESVKAQLAEIQRGQTDMMSRLSRPMVPITQDLIESDPAAAAQAAVDQDNPQALQVAIEAWTNGTDFTDGNPEAARLFMDNIALQIRMQDLAQPAPAAQPAQVNEQQELESEVEKVRARNPDFDKLVPIIDQVAEAHPILARGVQVGTPSERAQALESLVTIARSQQGADTSREAMAKVQVVVKQEADEARAKARVVSASRGTAATATQPSRVEQFLDAFEKHVGISSEED